MQPEPRRHLHECLGCTPAPAPSCGCSYACLLGTIAVLATGTPGEADILQSFVVRLASQQNDVADAALWLLLVSVIAMAVSTMSAMFSRSEERRVGKECR